MCYQQLNSANKMSNATSVYSFKDLFDIIYHEAQIDKIYYLLTNHREELYIEKVNIDGWGLIHKCAAYGTQSILKMLIDFGTDINSRSDGVILLHYQLQRKNNLPCLKELIKAGADMSVTNNMNQNVASFLAHNNIKYIDVLDEHNSLDFYWNNTEIVLDIAEDNFKLKFKIPW